MKKDLAAACIFAALGLFAAGAQESTASEKTVTLSIDQAVDYALEHSRTLKSNDIDLDIKARAAKYAWNVFLPTVNATFTAARTSDIDSTLQSINGSASMMGLIQQLHPGVPIPAAETVSESEKLHWALVGGISAKLNLSLAYIDQIRAAKASYECGQISWEQNKRQTVVNIKKLFYGLLLQQESLGVKKATLTNARQRAEQAEINFRNGIIPELSLLNAQVTYQNQRPEVETAERTLNQQLDTFAFLLGLPVGTKIELTGSIEPIYVDLTTDELLEKYSQNNLDIQSLQSNIDILKLNLSALNFSTYTPALSLAYNWQPTKTFFSDSSKWVDQGKLSITFAWNITNMLPFSDNRQKAQDLKANIEKLDLSMETLHENQKVEVRKAVDTLNQAREQIDSMGRNITLAQRAYDSSSRSYRNGTTELLDLRDAENQLNQARLGQLNQKFNYISALMDLEYTLNTDLSEYIKE